MGFPLTDVITTIGNIVSKAIPDADKRAEIELEFAKLADQQSARDSELLEGQIDVNKIEAANPNLFVSGWRPSIGWVGSTALAYTFVIAPLFHLQTIDTQSILELVFALLGIGGLRTFEKVAGVATASAVPQAAALNNPVSRTVSKWFGK